jgi:flavin reductase (DIM6/NTAB) family NADH-FMN oxidoreductase RutF
MKKDLGVKPYIFPMPILTIAAYDEDEKVNVMNSAWGGVCAENMVALNIDEHNKTTQSIIARGAFTVSFADLDHMQEADLFGMVADSSTFNKFERTNLHTQKSRYVDAPVIEEFPLSMECKVVECQHTIYGFRVLGQIINVIADKKVLDDKGRVDPLKMNTFIFDQYQNGYYSVGQKVGQAWQVGARLLKD